MDILLTYIVSAHTDTTMIQYHIVTLAYVNKKAINLLELSAHANQNIHIINSIIDM